MNEENSFQPLLSFFLFVVVFVFVSINNSNKWMKLNAEFVFVVVLSYKRDKKPPKEVQI